MEFSFPVLDRLQGLISRVDGPLGAELRDAFKTLLGQLGATKEHVERLTEAQADALVNSAMLMTELQEARAELEGAHTATKGMNRTLERALSEVCASEERFRLLSDTAPIGIFQIDAAAQCLYANAYLRQIFRVSASAADEVDWRQWLQPDDRDAVLANWASAVAEQREFFAEFRVRTTDGEDRWVSVCAKTLFFGDGQFAGYIGTMSDVTERKEIDQLKDDLVSTVSHELRTPLSSLRGFVELLLQREFSPEKRAQFLTIIHNESLRLTRLINDFLDLQRMASGGQVYTFETIDVARFLQDRIALLSGENADQTLQLAVTEPLPPVSADVDRLHQVLVNLVSNAWKFSPPQSSVTVGACQRGREVIFSVKDCGAGIPAEALPQLFRKFFRVDNGATRKVGGTGLGLALVKEIVEAHHGRIWVESEVGVGSTFFFSLPLADASALIAERADSSVHSEGSLTV